MSEPVTMVGDTTASVSTVTFYVVNLSLDPCPPLSMQAGDWRLDLEPVPDLKEIQDRLDRTGGYAVTHLASLRRNDESAMALASAREGLSATMALLTFARGAWATPLLAVGFDADGRPVWHEWGEPHLAEWYRPQGWLDRRYPHLLEPVAGPFFERWKDPCWREVLWRVVGMYVEANKAGGRQSPFVESRLLGAVAALELLAWAILAGGAATPQPMPGSLMRGPRRTSRLGGSCSTRVWGPRSPPPCPTSQPRPGPTTGKGRTRRSPSFGTASLILAGEPTATSASSPAAHSSMPGCWRPGPPGRLARG